MPLPTAPPPLPPELALPEEPFSDVELDGFLGAVEADESSPVGGFVIDNDRRADWAMRKLAAIEAERATAQADADAWRAQIDDWLERRTAPLADRAGFFELHLIDYQRRRREADDRCKSLILPAGIVKSTGKPARAKIVDQEALVAWAREHRPQVVEETVTRKVPASALATLVELRTPVVALRYERHLDCGHPSSVEAAPEVSPNDLDFVAWCSTCRDRVAVLSFGEPEAVKGLVAVPKGYALGVTESIPGVEAEPAGVTFKVHPERP